MKKEFSLEQALPLMQEILDSDGEVSFTPSGTSMLPLFRDKKDKIVLKKPSGKLEKYDVPLYRRKDGSFVLHRVVGINSDGYIMCGDNQNVKEYSIKDENIVAVMTSFYRNGKYVPCSAFSYRLYSIIWTFLLPTRPLYRYTFALYRKIARIFNGKQNQ